MIARGIRRYQAAATDHLPNVVIGAIPLAIGVGSSLLTPAAIWRLNR